MTTTLNNPAYVRTASILHVLTEETKKRLEAEAQLAKLELKPISNNYRRPKLCPHCHKQI